MVRLRNRGCMGSLVTLGTAILTSLAVIGVGEAVLDAMSEGRYKLDCHTVSYSGTFRCFQWYSDGGSSVEKLALFVVGWVALFA